MLTGAHSSSRDDILVCCPTSTTDETKTSHHSGDQVTHNSLLYTLICIQVARLPACNL